MGRVKAGSLRLREAAELLELSYRQTKRVWARYRGGGAKARLSDAHGGRRHDYGVGAVLGRRNDLGGGGCVAPLDRALRGARSVVYGLEKRLCASPQRAGADAGRTRGDAVWTHVREAGHSHHRRQFAASERAGGAGARHASGPAGEEVAAGRDRELPPGQCVSGRALSGRAQPTLRAPSGGGGRLSPATAHGTATGRSVLAGGGTSGE